MVYSFLFIQLLPTIKTLTNNLNKHTHPPHTKEFRGDNMCMNTYEYDQYHPNSSTTRTPNFQVPRPLSKRLLKKAKNKARAREGALKREMEMKNLKLYMENKSIIEENERLRKKALLLHQENRVLLSQLENAANFSHNQHESMSL